MSKKAIWFRYIKLYRKNILVGATLLWIALIFSFSLQPAEVSEAVSSGVGEWVVETFMPDMSEYEEEEVLARWDQVHHLVRKAAHFAEFCVLGILVSCSVGLGTKGKSGKWRRKFLVLLVCIAVAVCDETIQLFVPGRAGQLRDVLLDCTGALVGMVCQFVCSQASSISRVMEW